MGHLEEECELDRTRVLKFIDEYACQCFFNTRGDLPIIEQLQRLLFLVDKVDQAVLHLVVAVVFEASAAVW